MEQPPQRPFVVECANCKQQIDAGKHTLPQPPGWPESKLHLRKDPGGFVGSVHCPNCNHFTIYFYSRN